MKVSKSGVESLSQGHLTWESLGVQDGFEDGLPPKKIKSGFKKTQKMADPASRLAMMCAEPLLQNLAGQTNLQQIDGVVLGSLLGCLLTDIRYFETAMPYKGSKASPLFFKNTLPSIPVGEICIAFKIKGPNTLVNTGEVSGISAIVQGAEWIDQKMVTTCLVGGG
jgi:3-oxoacyl-(acyl-carrier-protein) synthase